MEKINLFKKDYKTISQIPIDKNDEYLINYLLKEKYIEFENDEYPFYQHFFYSDYNDEDSLLELLKLKNKEKYPVLLKNLEKSNENKDIKKDISLET